MIGIRPTLQSPNMAAHKILHLCHENSPMTHPQSKMAKGCSRGLKHPAMTQPKNSSSPHSSVTSAGRSVKVAVGLLVPKPV